MANQGDDELLVREAASAGASAAGSLTADVTTARAPGSGPERF